MFVIARPVVVETEVKKSRFLCRLERVDDLAAADAVIAATRRAHPQARHHCAALRIGPHAERQRSNDDGEPAGTAGAPMLEALTGRELTDVVAVVTRYFGGVLLGTGGLVRAYAGAVAAAVDEAGILRLATLAVLGVSLPIADAGRFENALRGTGHLVDDVDHLTTPGRVTFRILVEPGEVTDVLGWVAGASSGRAVVDALGEQQRAVPAPPSP